MPSAKVYSSEASAPRERVVARSQMTLYLSFKDTEDDKKYHDSQKNLFFFPTFWPVIVAFILFSASQTSVFSELKKGDAMQIISFVFNILASILMIFFSLAQLIDYFTARMHKNLVRFSKFILKKIFFGHLEDVIILSATLGSGFYLLSLVSRDLCATCNTAFDIEQCMDSNDRNFPIDQALLCYVVLIVMPIYFKSIHRYVLITSWVTFSLFVIATYFYGDYQVDLVVILFVFFFLFALWEFERYKMNSYLLSKEALSFEQNKLMIMQEKSKVIERKLHLALVHQILPPKVAEQIIAGKQVKPEAFEQVTIFFSDVVGFTTICAQVGPIEVVRMLNDLYTVMDYCTSLFPLYKVETIGDAYMLVGGLPEKDPKHASQIANFALIVQKAVQAVKSPIDGSPINIRIGIHSGPVMAGVVGNLMPRYCLFGDTVNTASRMESNGLPNRIHCSAATAEILLAAGKHILDCRGEIDVKGKGKMTTYWLERAVESNELANAEAIAKTELMVQEILDASYEDKVIYESDHKRRDTGATNHSSSGKNESASDHALSPQDFASPRSDFGTGSKQSSAHESSHSRVRHSVRYQVTHRKNGSSTKDIETSFEGVKILVVEDSNAQRKMLMHSLNKADKTWDVVGASSGEDALQKLKAAKLQFDVVFVDENLSSNDGLYGHELVQVMRGSFHMKSTVIIACTSNPNKARDELLEAGVDYVWPKPPPAPGIIKQKITVLLQAKLREYAQSMTSTIADEKQLD